MGGGAVSDNTLLAYFALLILLVILAFCGEPDLHSAVIQYLECEP